MEIPGPKVGGMQISERIVHAFADIECDLSFMRSSDKHIHCSGVHPTRLYPSFAFPHISIPPPFAHISS